MHSFPVRFLTVLLVIAALGLVRVFAAEARTTPDSSSSSAALAAAPDCDGHITVHKFEDLNANGIEDPPLEKGLQGWTIQLQILSGSNWVNQGLPKTTNSAGDVLFTGLPAGTYRARETLQTGWQCTTCPDPSRPVSGSVVLAYDGTATIKIGNVDGPVIKVWKFLDPLNSGVYSPTAVLLDGWTFTLDPASNGISQGTTAGGTVTFIKLTPGSTYTVTEQPQVNWCATTPDQQTVTNIGPDAVVNLYFGNRECSPSAVTIASFRVSGASGVPLLALPWLLGILTLVGIAKATGVVRVCSRDLLR